jgi:8-oxo-dGTP diphosphatase
MLVHEGKALIIRRSIKESFLPGYFELPGGKVNFGEHPEVALIREFKEETRLNITVKQPIRAFHYVTLANTLQTVEIVYIVTLADGLDDIVLTPAHDQFRWITNDRLNSLKLSDEIRANLLAGFKLV